MTGEARGRRRRRRIVAWLAGVTAAALAIHVAPALAEANSVRIEPPRADVAANSRTRVALVAEPPPATLAAWVIEVRFDPDVVTATSRDCDPFDSPPGAAAAAGCDVVDTDGDGADDTVKAYGGVVFQSGKGLSSTSTLATIDFTSRAAAGQCSDLLVKATAFADSSGEETNPSVSHGRICVQDGLPGTAPTTGGPTATPGDGASAGGTTDGNGSASPGAIPAGVEPAATGSPDAGDLSGGQTAGVGGAPGRDQGTDDDGPGIVVWLLIGTGLATAAGGGGLFLKWRRR